MDIEQAFITAVLSGNFDVARELFDRLPFPEREVPVDGDWRREMLRARVGLRWRTSFMDTVLTKFGSEGIKGGWSAQVAGRDVLFGFDEHVVLSPDNSEADVDALRKARILVAR